MILNGTFNPAESKENATNYWWGLGSNILDVAFSSRFDPYAARTVNHFRELIRDGSFTPFEGELRDQAVPSAARRTAASPRRKSSAWIIWRTISSEPFPERKN